jgi:hypothetical protein
MEATMDTEYLATNKVSRAAAPIPPKKKPGKMVEWGTKTHYKLYLGEGPDVRAVHSRPVEPTQKRFRVSHQNQLLIMKTMCS